MQNSYINFILAPPKFSNLKKFAEIDEIKWR